MISLILAVICIMTCFSSVSFATTEYTSGIYTYTVSGSSATVVGVPETTKGEVNIPSTLGGYTVTAIGSLAMYGCTMVSSVSLPGTVTSIGTSAFGYCSSMASIYLPKSLKTIGKNAFYNCSSLKNVYYSGSTSNKASMTIDSTNDALNKADWTYNYVSEEYNPYNMGEETYRFKNYTDDDSKGGHCFGMSSTSSGYYLGILDKSAIGSSSQSLYSFSDSSKVKAPICHYHAIQGTIRDNAMVAGGHFYSSKYSSNLKSDWEQVVNYVKDHSHDGKGDLQIGIRGKYTNSEGKIVPGGHAINFLRYEVVSGQQRIYAYDNNFPNTETYFYMIDGKLYQAPKQTFDISLTSITLRSVEKYFENVSVYKKSKYLYAYEGQIDIKNATATTMDTDILYDTKGEYLMYELPEGVENVTITPLVDNAEFTYCDTDYSFGEIDEDTCGTLKLVTDDSSDDTPVKTTFKIGKFSEIECRIKNMSLFNNKSVNYYSTITFHPDCEDVTNIRWHSEGATGTQNGNDFTVANAKNSYKVWYTAKDSSGNEVKSDVETVIVRNTFIDKILSIIMCLLNSNAYVYDQR